MSALYYMLQRVIRRARLKRRARRCIEQCGGRVTYMGMVGWHWPPRFTHHLEAVYLRVECEYPGDHGSWVIRKTNSGHVKWVWRSSTGSLSLPCEMSDYYASVDNSFRLIPSWVLRLLVATSCVAAMGALLFAAVVLVVAG